MLAMRMGAACPSSDHATEDAVCDGRPKLVDLQGFPSIGGMARSGSPHGVKNGRGLTALSYGGCSVKPNETRGTSAQSFCPPRVRV